MLCAEWTEKLGGGRETGQEEAEETQGDMTVARRSRGGGMGEVVRGGGLDISEGKADSGMWT